MRGVAADARLEHPKETVLATAAAASKTASHPALGRLIAICGDAHVLTSEEDRAFYAADVYGAGTAPLAVVSPATAEETASVLAAASHAGLAVFPRGAGMSYSAAFLPDRGDALVLDLSRLDRLIALDAERLYVTVECGMTWKALDEALAPHGLRASFWGPMSGGTSTVGGALSQGAATFGSGVAGASGHNLLGLRVALMDGTLVDTGTDSQPHARPFFRNYGPDLTGLFAHDCGAFGIKVAATLPLEPRPGAVGALGFGFPDFASAAAAVAAVSRDGLASEIVVMDRALLKMNLAAGGLTSGVQMLRSIVAAGPTLVSGLRSAVSVAAAGRNFADRAAFSAHFVVEGTGSGELAARRKRLRSLAAPHGFKISGSVGMTMRAVPFPDLPVTAADGRRLLALHAIVPFPDAPALHEEVSACLADRRAELGRHGVEPMTVASTLGRRAMLYEPFIYWKDSRTAYHERQTPEAMRPYLQDFEDNPAARETVERLRRDLTDIFYRHGGAHLQIGRAYPFLRGRQDGYDGLMRGLKALVDPDGLMNPGVLGLAKEMG